MALVPTPHIIPFLFSCQEHTQIKGLDNLGIELHNTLFLRKTLENSQVQKCQVTPLAETYAKMERVKESNQKALPSLSSYLVESLMFILEMIGVNCVDDLSFVKTEDLEGILPPIQCRRVIQAFSADSQVELNPTAEPLQQNNCKLQPSPASSGSMECSSSCESYVVPWHKMPPNLMLAVGEKKRPKPRETGTCSHHC
ncbi:hypothetical protein AMECASPLE_008780 [Ameca splendens]|uniref:Uncharacterized protein n=1 Tax=Ameca splendens TaxID=208324 RepID=A0ABV0XZY2_9TELE